MKTYSFDERSGAAQTQLEDAACRHLAGDHGALAEFRAAARDLRALGWKVTLHEVARGSFDFDFTFDPERAADSIMGTLGDAALRAERGEKAVVENFPQPVAGKARDLAGKAFGVSGRSVAKANVVRDKGIPELVAKVERGEISVHQVEAKQSWKVTRGSSICSD
jgi:hypothetical protein